MFLIEAFKMRSLRLYVLMNFLDVVFINYACCAENKIVLLNRCHNLQKDHISNQMTKF